MDLKENCIVIITMIKKTNLDIKEVSNLLDIDTTTLKRSALADFNNIDIESLNKILKKKNYLYDFAKSHSEDLIPKISKDSHGLNVLDLYCGAGGLSSGFRQSGFKIVGGIEKIPIYAKTHDLNFPEALTFCADINNLDLNELKRRLNKNIDIIIGGPPCQTFSSLGRGKIRSLQRNIKDDVRNFEYMNFIKYVDFFKPKAFVMENVPGFKTQYEGKIFDEFLSNFKNSSYSIYHSLISASNNGIPQNRKRLFVVGIRDGTGFQFPSGSQDLKITVDEAISDLPSISDDWRISKMKYSKFNQLSNYQILLRNSSEYVYNNICRISNIHAKRAFKFLKPSQRLSEIDQEVFKTLEISKLFKSKIIYNRIRRLPVDEPSWTVVAHIGIDGYEYVHPYFERTLSVREAARLQSFPDNFIFLGNMREQYLQVGNAVPPLLAKKIAQSLSKELSN